MTSKRLDQIKQEENEAQKDYIQIERSISEAFEEVAEMNKKFELNRDFTFEVKFS